MLAIFDRVVIVTGSRKWDDQPFIDAVLTGLRPTLVVHCGADGADDIADIWARKQCVTCWAFPKSGNDWARYGKRAGSIANTVVLQTFPLAIVVAFPLADSRGTVDCVRQARERRMMVQVYGPHAAVCG